MKPFDLMVEVPDEIVHHAAAVKAWMAHHGIGSVCGLGVVHELQRELAEATDRNVWLLEAAIRMQGVMEDAQRERDTFKAMLDVQNLRAELVGDRRRRRTNTEEIPR